MASDIVHSGEIVDQVIAVLKGGDGDSHTNGLPVAWFTSGDDEYLRTLEHGDWSDYPNDEWLDRLPAILVRGLGPVPTGDATIRQTLQTEERVRVVHIRAHDQCYTAAGALERNMTRARERYAKIIGKALFADPHKRLAVVGSEGSRTEATLTSADTGGAQVVNALFGGWDMGHDIDTANATPDVDLVRGLNARVWAIACDLRVIVNNGRQT